MLIADDESDIRVLVSDVLRRAQIEVIEAADAEETLAQWRAQEPDVVILDHLIPPASGFDIAEQILGERPDQVIFLFTAMIDPTVRATCERLGIALCVPKERVFDLPDLIREAVSRG